MNRQLLQLLMDNRRQPNDDDGIVIAKKEDVASVYLYDVIDSWYGIAAEPFVKALNALDAKTIHLHINSPGGDVFEARTMATAVRNHPAHVVAFVDGLAASAATSVLMAADEIEMATGAFLMIHNAWTGTIGNAAEHDQTAALLRKVDDAIRADYAARTGKDEQTLRQWMDAETWFNADEAVANGFANRVGSAQATNQWNLAAYANTPQALSASARDANAQTAQRAEMYAAALQRARLLTVSL